MRHSISTLLILFFHCPLQRTNNINRLTLLSYPLPSRPPWIFHSHQPPPPANSNAISSAAALIPPHTLNSPDQPRTCGRPIHQRLKRPASYKMEPRKMSWVRWISGDGGRHPGPYQVRFLLISFFPVLISDTARQKSLDYRMIPCSASTFHSTFTRVTFLFLCPIFQLNEPHQTLLS